MNGATGPVADFLRSEVAAGRIPGAAWRLESRDRGRGGGAVGRVSVEPESLPALEDTVYDLGSLTKPLCTALLGVLLEQEGGLGLDLPVGDVVPELTGTELGRRSLLDLGAHRAGLPPWRPLYLQGASRSDYLAAIADLPLQPGAEALYSDLGYLVLGWAIESVAGRTLDTLFEERIVAPLDLRRTGFAVPGRFPQAAPTERGNVHERKMAGPAGERYRWRTEVIRGEVHDGNAHALGGVAGHAGLFGTASEVAAIAAEIAAPRRIPLGQGARRRLLVEPVPGLGRTFGFVTAAASGAARGVLPHRAPGHTGFTGTSVWLDPEGEAVFVLLTNRVHPVVADVDFQRVRAGFHVAALRS